MILLPIHPEFVEKIRSGEKRFEFRTRVPSGIGDDPLVAVYATAPAGAVVGYFLAAGVLSLPPTALWERTKGAAGISRERFRAYFRGRAAAHALEVGEWREFVRPLSVEELRGSPTPPQSFAILSAEQRRRVLRRATKGQGK